MFIIPADSCKQWGCEHRWDVNILNPHMYFCLLMSLLRSTTHRANIGSEKVLPKRYSICPITVELYSHIE